MGIESILEILILAAGFYMAWNIGANDVSNAMGTSVGSGALTLRRAVLIAAVLEFAGAFFVGSNVSETMQRGLIDPAMFASSPITLILGMCGAMIGTSLWIHLASFLGWPVSTTHSIVGAILGFGAAIGGMDAVKWSEVGGIALSWILAPALSAIVSFVMFSVLQRRVLYAMSPTESAKKLLPWMTGFVLGIFTLSLIFNGLKNLHLKVSFVEAFLLALIVGGCAYFATRLLIKRFSPPTPQLEKSSSPHTLFSLQKAIKHLSRVQASSLDATQEKAASLLEEARKLSLQLSHETSISHRNSEYHIVEKLFSYLQILSACFVAFAHGANDVSNAIGPIAAVLAVIHGGIVADIASPIPSWLLAFGGVGIVIGLATYGWKVMKTIGKKITELTPTRGFCAEFGAAATILLASKLALPVSTTHCLVGAVLGVGIAGGLAALNMRTVREIATSWIVTLPASAAMSILCFILLKILFL